MLIKGNYYLIKRGEIVGEAVVMSEDHVVYHLWESIRETRTTTLERVKRKFKLEKKFN